MKRNWNSLGNVVILLLYCLAMSYCTSEENTILPKNVQLKAGDIVFRQGKSFDSQAVEHADREGVYSHIGIVVDSAGHPMIVHAVPDEPDYPGDTDRIKMDTPRTFFLASRAEIGEIMRPKSKRAAIHAGKVALQLYHKEIPFDHLYNDADSSKMYCTELVIYSYRKAGVNLAARPQQNITFPIHFKGYFPSAVHASPELVSICKF